MSGHNFRDVGADMSTALSVHLQVALEEGVKPGMKKEEELLGPKLEMGLEEIEGSSYIAQTEIPGQSQSWADLQCIKQEPEAEQFLQQWEAQWQEFLQTLQTPRFGERSPQLPQTQLWDGPKSPKPSFEGATATSPWIREERTVQEVIFRPGTPGWKEQEQSKAIKMEDTAESEAQRQRFRQLCYQDAQGPREVYGCLQKLCYQWLNPERHTKEQMLDLVVLEQFLAVLPLEMQNWVKGRGYENCFHAVALAEDFLQRQEEAERSERKGPGTMREEVESITGEKHSTLDPGQEAESRDVVQLNVESQTLDWQQTNEYGGKNKLRTLQLVEPLQKVFQKQARGSIFQGETEDQSSRSLRKSKRQQKSHTKIRMSKSFPCADLLWQCQQTHAMKESHKCSYCGKIFNGQSHLIIHERTHTGEKAHKSPVYAKNFSHNSNLIVHEQTHTEEKPYKDSYGEKSLGHSSFHIKYNKTHTGEKPYRCSSCPKSFRQRSCLTIHERTHTGEKPFQCSNCGKSFTRSSHLVEHWRTHTGEKPYKCSACEKNFQRNSHLVRHQQTHTGEKPYKCSVCGKSFNYKSNLVRHEKTHTQKNNTSAQNVGCNQRIGAEKSHGSDNRSLWGKLVLSLMGEVVACQCNTHTYTQESAP